MWKKIDRFLKVWIKKFVHVLENLKSFFTDLLNHMGPIACWRSKHSPSAIWPDAQWTRHWKQLLPHLSTKSVNFSLKISSINCKSNRFCHIRFCHIRSYHSRFFWFLDNKCEFQFKNKLDKFALVNYFHFC